MCLKRYYVKYKMQMDHILKTTCLVKHREENEYCHLEWKVQIGDSASEHSLFKLNL